MERDRERDREAVFVNPPYEGGPLVAGENIKFTGPIIVHFSIDLSWDMMEKAIEDQFKE